MILPAQMPSAFWPFTQPARYKVAYGGRGSAKSTSFADLLLAKAAATPRRVLCTRELQSSIKDSVHKLLVDRIDALGLTRGFDVTDHAIRCRWTGSNFIFKGLRHNINSIKSTEGIDDCWVEEAHSVSKQSWAILIPTIRKPGSEIWVSMNPDLERDESYQRFVAKPPPNSIIRKINFRANPWFPTVLEDERQYLLANDLEAYQHVWEGNCRAASRAAIFAHKVRVDSFEMPKGTRPYYGADWGFAVDPTVLLRCYILDDRLWIDYAQFGFKTELDDIPTLFDRVPGSRDWPIIADCARPETISYIKSKGFNIRPCEKWDGSIEDGIAHLLTFKEIVIHQRCVNMRDESVLYSYKVDKNTDDILPEVVDKHNHGWDSARYALDRMIKRRGSKAQWAKFGQAA